MDKIFEQAGLQKNLQPAFFECMGKLMAPSFKDEKWEQIPFLIDSTRGGLTEYKTWPRKAQKNGNRGK